MNVAHNYLWLAKMVLEGLLFLWPITVTLLLFMSFTSYFRFPFTPSNFRRKNLFVFSPFLLSILLLLIGTLAAAVGPTADVSKSAEILIGILFWLHIPVSLIVVYNLKGYRWFAASVVLFAFWIGISCSFIAGMAVTDKWP